MTVSHHVSSFHSLLIRTPLRSPSTRGALLTRLQMPVHRLQENDAQLLKYLESNSKEALSEELQRELATNSSTVTPWWWGLLTLIKVSVAVWECGGRRWELKVGVADTHPDGRGGRQRAGTADADPGVCGALGDRRLGQRWLARVQWGKAEGFRLLRKPRGQRKVLVSSLTCSIT